jgi:formamidopyrimidine-DNA glycosylase
VPELPEVETVRRGLEPAMQGAHFAAVKVRRSDLRFPLPKDFVQRLIGKTVMGLGRRAKYILADLSSREVLIMHLGMSGSFRVSKSSEEKTPGEFHRQRSNNAKHDHIVFELSSGWTLTFNDPRRFGFMKLVARNEFERDPLFRAIGPEPLGNTFDAAILARACKGKKTTLKVALSDQKVVAGLGNIYVCEALYQARLSPRHMASILANKKGEPTEAAHTVVDAIKNVLNQAIKAGGSSLRNHRQTTGELGYFQHSFRVYDREGEKCMTPDCGGKILRIVQTGRSSFYCPVCQR